MVMMSLKIASKSAKRKERLTWQKELKKRKRKNGPIMLNTISAVKLLPGVRNLKLLPGVKPAMTNIRKRNANVILLLKAITFMTLMRYYKSVHCI
jgi:hypothetical protein